jgi:hypothetical protein
MYPDDCIQSVVGGDWWLKNEDRTLCRGALIVAFSPHVDQVPYSFEPVGRKEADRHSDAVVKVSPLKVDQPLQQADLPVAAMTLHHGEVWAAYRAKKRPCIVVGMPGARVDKLLVRGTANSATAPTMLVVPSYGVQRNTNRAGYPPEFVERVRHLEYAQFLWDKLPESDDTPESIIRLDHLQPVGTHYSSFKITGWKLGNAGLNVIDDLLSLLMQGGVPADSLVNMYRELIKEYVVAPAEQKDR